uniref:PLD phosphodiesterase domain-containing protein n=1 Tax=Wuchereria bancrofti TaxID=6293 RepID=A0AAF5RT20_WUCBA
MFSWNKCKLQNSSLLSISLHTYSNLNLSIFSVQDVREYFCINKNGCNCFRIKLVQSTPDNLTFATVTRSHSTYSAWNSLIKNSKKELILAAYKTSLRGKHVLNDDNCQLHSNQGSKIYDALVEAGLKRKIRIRMIENYPPKDKGDNEDGINFAKTGVISRRNLNLEYLSLNQVLFLEKYFLIRDNRKSYNEQRPLSISNEHVLADVYIAANLRFLNSEHRRIGLKKQGNYLRLAAVYLKHLKASPRSLNDLGRDWDLFAILNAIEKTTKFLYIEVMDYFPIYWPVIDNAIRRAILRGVEVKILTAAIHFPEYSLRFLSSLEALNRINDSSMEVKIFKVPTDVSMQHIMKRERRMHTKFLVTDTVAVIGTSNWSGDYFDGGTTGVAFVLNQTKASLEKRHFIRDLRYIFLSHWLVIVRNYCEAEKDPSLLAL